ncbi:MAG TPA: DUF3108 domain-containing protein [Burkholderiales bacterium]|nr:DUF3108 domain-containing protein [Burkholderiales bacterium]
MFLALISFAAPAWAALPGHLELSYQVTRNGSAIAQIDQTLDYDARQYQLSESWQGRGLFRLLGSAHRKSRGEVGADGLVPLEYSDERTGRSAEHANFDWKAKTVTYQYKGPPTTIPLPANPRDRLQFLFQFAFKPPSGKQVALDVIDGRGVSDQVYQLEGRERFKTPAGEFDALKLVRRKDKNERAEIWLAADRDYLPVRILWITKDGDRIDQVLTRLAQP